MIPPTRLQTILICLILLLAGAYDVAVLNRPFQRDFEGCGAFYGLVARNYFRYSMSETRGIQVMSMGAGAPIVFYANHPPTTPLLIAAVYFVSGYRGAYDHLPGDWQVRLPTALFTLGCIALIYLLISRRGSPRAGLLAAGFFAFIPMTLIYGGQPDSINTQLVFFALLTIAAYERFCDQPTWRGLGWLSAAFLGAAIMDWPAFFLLPVLSLHFISKQPSRRWGLMILFGLLSIAIFAGLYGYLSWGQTDTDWMLYNFKRRGLSTLTDAASRITLRKWLWHAVWEMWIGKHTWVVTLLAVLWVATALTRRLAGTADRFTALLLAWGGLHLLVGRQGVYMHEWWWWPITPGLAIAAALGLDQLINLLHQRWLIPRIALNASVMAFMIIFALCNVRPALHSLLGPHPLFGGEFDYSLQELGQAIRAHTPPDCAAMMTESDQSLALWYYADRALKRGIWDSPTFHDRLDDRMIDLSFDKPAAWNGPICSMLIPKTYLKSLVPPLLDELEARHPRENLAKFLLYDLNAEKTAAP